MIEKQRISFIGCGNMAKAIILGLVESGFPAQQITASNRGMEKLNALQEQVAIQITTDNLAAVNQSDIVILAVKPHLMASVSEAFKTLDLTDKLFISVAAGVKTTQLSEYLGAHCAIVRAMPNTPATVRAAATALFASEQVSDTQKFLATQIFEAVGKVAWLEQESQLDAIVGIAGSSPAYIFQFAHAMVEQGIQEGLEEKTAREMALQAILGAAQLALSEEQTSLEALRIAVTSKGGATAAALQSLEVNNFTAIVKQAVSAAAHKSQLLGKPQ